MDNQNIRNAARKERLMQAYPAGSRVELIGLCNNEPGMPGGLRGTVIGVDDWPALLMEWDNGRTLSLLPGEDSFRKLAAEETETENQDAGITQGGPAIKMG